MKINWWLMGAGIIVGAIAGVSMHGLFHAAGASADMCLVANMATAFLVANAFARAALD